MTINSQAEKLKPNKTEVVSSKMYDMADMVDALKQPKPYRTFNSVGTEFANGNFDKGQRLLESNGFWDDKVRAVASEANQASREQSGAVQFGFDEAKNAIDRYAKSLEALGERQDRDGAMQIESLVRGMDRPGQSGVDGIEDTLKYVEGLLQTKTHLERQMNPAMKKQWEEQRAVRDSLLAEKKRRVDRMKQAQQSGESLTGDRILAGRVLENLYNNAGIPEEVFSRQELTRRVGGMSSEELHFLNDELRKAAASYNMRGDKKSLDATLMDLATRRFTKQSVRAQNKTRDEQELELVRIKLKGGKPLEIPKPEDRPNVEVAKGPEAKKDQRKSPTETMPQDSRSLNRFYNENFEKVASGSPG